MNSTTIMEGDGYGYSDRMIIFVVGIILTFIMCVIGSFGNLISIAVLTKVVLRGTRCPLFVILIALASLDSAVLLLNFGTNILSIGLPYTRLTLTVPLYLRHGSIIRVLWPILLGAQMSSIYLTVLVSYERWIAVVQPFRASRRVWSFRKLVVIIGSIVGMSMVYNIPRLWEYIPVKEAVQDVVDLLPEDYFCDAVKYNQTAIAENQNLYGILLFQKCNLSVMSFTKSTMGVSPLYRYGYCITLYILVMFLIPFIMITYMNVVLLQCLKKSKQKWGTMSRSQRSEVRLSYVPLAIVCLFYIFGMPAVVINFIDSLEIAPSQVGSRGFGLWQAALLVSNFFVIINSSINFVIYCFLGQKFRKTLVGLCQCAPHRRMFIARALQSNQPITILGFKNKKKKNKFQQSSLYSSFQDLSVTEF